MLNIIKRFLGYRDMFSGNRQTNDRLWYTVIALSVGSIIINVWYSDDSHDRLSSL